MMGFSIMLWFCSVIMIILSISLLRGNYDSMHGKVFDNTTDKTRYAKALGKPIFSIRDRYCCCWCSRNGNTRILFNCYFNYCFIAVCYYSWNMVC